MPPDTCPSDSSLEACRSLARLLCFPGMYQGYQDVAHLTDGCPSPTPQEEGGMPPPDVVGD